MTAPVGRVVLSDPASVHGGVGPVMLVLHEDGTVTWRPIYQTVKGRKFVEKENADGPVETEQDGSEPAARHYARLIRDKQIGTVHSVEGPNGTITNWETEGALAPKPVLWHPTTGNAS